MEGQIIGRDAQSRDPHDYWLILLEPRFELHTDKHEVSVMNRIKIISVATGTALGMAILMMTNVAQAFDMGNMMNPGEWFDNDNDHYRYDRGYGGYGPYGYGGGPYGYGAGPYGYGAGPYGYGGYPGYGGNGGYGQQRTIVVNPSSGAERASTPPRLPE